MATIHKTTLTPSKLDLAARWMRAEPWYRGATTPNLSVVGGFRLDDPEGEVGLEFIVVRDDPDEVHYLLPFTYRGAPLPDGESENHLVGTLEHGVLGTRYVYDGPYDPVWRASVASLLDGEAEPQAGGVSDTPDRTVLLVAGTEAGEVGEATVVRVVEPGEPEGPGVVLPFEGPDGADVTARVLRGAPGTADS